MSESVEEIKIYSGEIMKKNENGVWCMYSSNGQLLSEVDLLVIIEKLNSKLNKQDVRYVSKLERQIRSLRNALNILNNENDTLRARLRGSERKK